MDKTDKLVEWLTDAAQKGGDFIEREAPLFAQEAVAWAFWAGIIGIAIGACLLLAGAVLAWNAWRLSHFPECDFGKAPNATSLAQLGSGAASVLFVVIGLLAIGCNIYGVVKSQVAPRVVIVQSLR